MHLTATVADVETERDEHAAHVEKETQARAAAESDRDDATARAARAEEGERTPWRLSAIAWPRRLPRLSSASPA